MDPIDMRDFGRLEANVEAQGREIGELKGTIDKMAKQIDDLLALANQGRGGLWAGMAIVSAASSVGGWFMHNVLNK